MMMMAKKALLAFALTPRPSLPFQQPASVRSVRRVATTFAADMVGPMGGGPGRDDEDPFWTQFTKTELAERAEELELGGENRVAAQYVVLLTKKHPSELVREFYGSASPRAAAAVTEAVSTLLGKAGDDAWTTTAKQIADLCFRLQMTGYMLRNAEYTVALRELLSIDEPTRAALRKAFDAVDSDSDGFLTIDEIDDLFDRIYYGSDEGREERKRATPDAELKRAKEAKSFLAYFDSDRDGRISFDEFCTGLGGTSPSSGRVDLDDDDVPLVRPAVSGEIELVFPNGKRRTVDAEQYMAELRKEADALRQALAKKSEPSNTAVAPFVAAPRGVERQPHEGTSLVTYVDGLTEDSRKALTETLTPDAKAAMAQLITYIFAGGGKDAPPAVPKDASLKIEHKFLRDLMQLQLITGYKIRELEALEVAEERAGRAGAGGFSS